MTAVMEEVEVKKEPKRIVPPARTAHEANSAYNKRVKEQEEALNEALDWAKSLEITSIKHLNGKATVIFEHGLAENFKAKTNAQSTGDVPTTFTSALDALATHVSLILFRSPDERIWQTPHIEVKGVNFRHFEEGNMHAGIVFTLTLQNGRSLNANTPMMPLYSDSPEVTCYEKDAAKAIERFISVTQTMLSKVEKTGNLFARLEN